MWRVEVNKDRVHEDGNLPAVTRPQVTEALQDHLGQMRFLESKVMREAPELQETLDRKDGLGIQGPRASLACMVFQGRKVGVHMKGLVLWTRPQSLYRALVLTILSSFQGPGASMDSWATLGPLELWATEAPKGPKETKDSQVSGACRACDATALT